MTLKVGIIRDDRYLDHKTGHAHPEHPARLKAIYRMLDREFSYGLVDIEPAMATMEQLELVHTPLYIDMVLRTAQLSFTSLAPDTPASALTYRAAWLAVGGCIRGLEALLSGACDVCFALIRPPGHHAFPSHGSGFCVFNNLGVTARYAQKRYGFQRILIVDWDIHHGNGLNSLFSEEKEVFYFSSHDTNLFPHSGTWEDAGKAKGEGYTLNIPLPRDLTDPEMLSLYQQILFPLCEFFQPELLLIAAGFDAHEADPVGKSHLTERAFISLTGLILDLRAQGNHAPVLLALEGGYNPTALAHCVNGVLKRLRDGPPKDPLAPENTERVMCLVQQARAVHGKYGLWTAG